MNSSLPWYKQFWPWFVFGLPAITVVAGIITVVIAVKHADSLVADDYYKEGLAINVNLKKEQLAAQLGLDLDFAIDKQQQRIIVKLDNPQEISLPEMLQLRLIHPVDKKLDQQFPLYFDAASKSFSQQYSSMPDIDWLLEVEPLYLSNQEHNPTWKLRSKRSKLKHYAN